MTPTEARALAKYRDIAMPDGIRDALRSLADQVEALQGVLADIAYSDDMTLKIAKAKAGRVYRATREEK